MSCLFSCCFGPSSSARVTPFPVSNDNELLRKTILQSSPHPPCTSQDRLADLPPLSDRISVQQRGKASTSYPLFYNKDGYVYYDPSLTLEQHNLQPDVIATQLFSDCKQSQPTDVPKTFGDPYLTLIYHPLITANGLAVVSYCDTKNEYHITILSRPNPDSDPSATIYSLDSRRITEQLTKIMKPHPALSGWKRSSAT